MSQRPDPAEWSGYEDDLPFPHGTPLLFDGRLQAGWRDATFVSCPDVYSDKARHVVVASRQIAIGPGEEGLAAACDPRRIMIGFPVKDATEVHPNGRCQRPGCKQLFARAAALAASPAHGSGPAWTPAASSARDRAAAKAAGELRALADRAPAGDSPPVTLARQRAASAVDAVTAALAADPTLAERQQRWIDLLGELLRRLTPLARQVLVAAESERLAAAGETTYHLGRINPLAAQELDPVSARCQELAVQITVAAWPDWESPARIRELSAMRMPHEQELARIADALRRAVAPSLELPCPDPEAIRLAALADQIAPPGAEE